MESSNTVGAPQSWKWPKRSSYLIADCISSTTHWWVNSIPLFIHLQNLPSPELEPTLVQYFPFSIKWKLGLLKHSLSFQTWVPWRTRMILPHASATYIHCVEEMATHSSILAWRLPWTEEPGGLQSTGSQRAGHDWVTGNIDTVRACLLSHSVISTLTPWAIARQAPPSMGFPRQEHWSGLPLPSPGSSWPRDWTCISCIGRYTLPSVKQTATKKLPYNTGSSAQGSAMT